LSTYVAIPVLALAAVLNATVMAEFRLGGGAPDLVFMLVVSWALLADPRTAFGWAVLGGIMQDSLSVAPLGTSSLGLVIVVFLADAIFGQRQRINLLYPLLVAAGGTVIYHLCIMAVLRVMEGITVPMGSGLFYVTVPTVIYNSILIVPVYRMVAVVYRGFQPQRPRVE
jgi:rod shape-determining protein MreD